MTTIYLINNNYTMNNLNFPSHESLDSKREKRILSIEGEKESAKLKNIPYLEHVQAIYTSNYVMSIGTAKYLAKDLELDINIDSDLGERVLGNLGDKKIRMVTEMQENDFDYNLFSFHYLDQIDMDKKFMYFNINEKEKLEKIVKKLEAGDVPLDDAINEFNKAMNLAKICDAKLKNAEEAINQIVKEDGTMEEFKNIEE